MHLPFGGKPTSTVGRGDGGGAPAAPKGRARVTRPRLLDLFCANSTWLGVEYQPQFPFIHGHALEDVPLHGLTAITAYIATMQVRAAGTQDPDLVEETRDALQLSGLPWVIENVPGAHGHGGAFRGYAAAACLKRPGAGSRTCSADPRWARCPVEDRDGVAPTQRRRARHRLDEPRRTGGIHPPRLDA